MIIETTQDIANLVKQARKQQGMTQAELAMVSNIGIRFLSDLENGKPTCEIEKVLKILKNLGIRLDVEI